MSHDREVTPEKQHKISQTNTFNELKECTQSRADNKVTYTQLQNILQNVKNIKKKTKDTISDLQTKNRVLENEAKILKEQLQNYQIVIDRIEKEKYTINKQKQQKNKMMKNKQIQHSQKLIAIKKEMDSMIVLLKKQLEKKNCEIGELNTTVENYEKQLEQVEQQQEKQFQQIQIKYKKILQQSEQNYKKKLQQIEQKYKQSEQKYYKITKTLKINEQSTQLSTITEQYIDIPNLLQIATSLKLNEQKFSHSIESLNKHNEQLRNQISQNNKTINTMTIQNQQFLTMIETLRKQKQNLLNKQPDGEIKKSKTTNEKDYNSTEIKEQISINKNYESILKQYQQKLSLLRNQIASLQNKLIEAAERQRISKQQQQFQMRIEEVCDELDDYQYIVSKIQYLQKYRMQYYLNVKKISFLCKILDQ